MTVNYLIDMVTSPICTAAVVTADADFGVKVIHRMSVHVSSSQRQNYKMNIC